MHLFSLNIYYCKLRVHNKGRQVPQTSSLPKQKDAAFKGRGTPSGTLPLITVFVKTKKALGLANRLFPNAFIFYSPCGPYLYTRRESNPNRRNRNPLFYPLNYGCNLAYALFRQKHHILHFRLAKVIIYL